MTPPAGVRVTVNAQVTVNVSSIPMYAIIIYRILSSCQRWIRDGH